MKKFFTSLLLLAVGVMFAEAQSITIGNKSIDLTKDGTYTGIGTSSGTATYKASSKSLYLKNVSLTNQKIHGKNLGTSATDRFYIYLESDLYIKHSEGTCMRFDNSYIVFSGSNHTITLDGSYYPYEGSSTFYAGGSDVSFWNTFLYVYAAGSNAFYGNQSKGKITFSNCKGRIISTLFGSAFEGFSSFTLDDCLFDDSSGLKFVSGTGVTFSNNKLAGSVEIHPYLRVGNEMVRTRATSAAGTNWTWNLETKTLTLNKANIEMSDTVSALENRGVDGLTLDVKGYCALKTTSTNAGSALKTHKSMKITGEGASLSKYLHLIGFVGLYLQTISESTLTIENATILAEGQNYGIVSNYGNTNLTINKSMVVAQSTINGAIGKLKSCQLINCDVMAISNPGVCYRQSLGGFGTPTELYKGDSQALIIMPYEASDTYPVYVLGKQLNSLIASNVAVDGLTSGTISYDNSSQKLTLDGVTMTAPAGNNEPGIKIASGSGDHEIELTGNANTITTQSDVFLLGSNATFTGNASGIFTSTAETALSGNSGACITLDISNFARFQGKKYGYWGTGNKSEVLTLKKTTFDTSAYRFFGETKCIHNLTKLDMTNLSFFCTANGENMKGCYFDENTLDIRQNGGTVAKNGWVAFAYTTDKFGVKVAGIEIDDINCSGIGSKFITAGGPEAVSYSKTSKTLTLNNATINTGYENVCGVENESVDGLTVKMVGDNVITSNHTGYNITNVPMYFRANTTITGDGSLYAVHGNMPIQTNGTAHLTIKDAKSIEATEIRSSTSGTSTLTIDNSNVTITNGNAYLFQNVTWKNCFLNEPVNGKFDLSARKFVNANGKSVSKVVFGATPVAIDALTVDQNADVRDIYDASGRRLEGAHKGLNVIRMTDGTVRKVMVK